MPRRKSKHGMQMGRGMVYRHTEGDQVVGQKPECLQPRIPRHSHLDVCFSPLPSGVPRPSGPAERSHGMGGLLPAVLTGQSSRKSCYVADHIVRTHAMQRSMRGKCHVDRELVHGHVEPDEGEANSTG